VNAADTSPHLKEDTFPYAQMGCGRLIRLRLWTGADNRTRRSRMPTVTI